MPRRRRKRTHAVRVLDTALERARQIVATRPGDLLGVGTGHKYARDMGGYGLRRIPCIKFFVRRKRSHREDARNLPRGIRVRVDGRTRVVPTDVEEMRGLRWQAAPVCREAGTVAPFGTPTAFFRDVNTDDVYLVTAGHVLRRAQNAASVRMVENSGAVASAGRSVGKVFGKGTYFERPAGSLVDIAVTKVTNRAAAAAMLDLHPWNSDWTLVSVDSLRDAVAEERPMDLWLAGMSGSKSLEFDAVMSSLTEDPLPVPVEDEGTVFYAPVLLHLRAMKRKPIGGDSGSPVLDEDDNLVGVHVLGAAESEEDDRDGAEATVAVVLSEALERLRKVTKLDLELIPTP